MSKKQQNYQLKIDTLNNITVSLVDHQEQLNTARLVNLIEHYRDFIENYADSGSEFPFYAIVELFFLIVELIRD